MGNSQAGRAMVQTALALRDIAGQSHAAKPWKSSICL